MNVVIFAVQCTLVNLSRPADRTWLAKYHLHVGTCRPLNQTSLASVRRSVAASDSSVLRGAGRG